MAEILYTERYAADLVRIYKYSARKWGRVVAAQTLQQIAKLEQNALTNPNFGKLDAQFHSAIYCYATISNRQTIFFHRLGEDVVMITAGYCGRDWHRILKGIEPQIRVFIEQAEGK